MLQTQYPILHAVLCQFLTEIAEHVTPSTLRRSAERVVVDREVMRDCIHPADMVIAQRILEPLENLLLGALPAEHPKHTAARQVLRMVAVVLGAGAFNEACRIPISRAYRDVTAWLLDGDSTAHDPEPVAAPTGWGVPWEIHDSELAALVSNDGTLRARLGKDTSIATTNLVSNTIEPTTEAVYNWLLFGRVLVPTTQAA